MRRTGWQCLQLVLLCAALQVALAQEEEPLLSNERVVFQLENGDFVGWPAAGAQQNRGSAVQGKGASAFARAVNSQEFAFLPEVAPVTAKHIFTLVQLGLYTTNQVRC